MNQSNQCGKLKIMLRRRPLTVTYLEQLYCLCMVPISYASVDLGSCAIAHDRLNNLDDEVETAGSSLQPTLLCDHDFVISN